MQPSAAGTRNARRQELVDVQLDEIPVDETCDGARREALDSGMDLLQGPEHCARCGVA